VLSWKLCLNFRLNEIIWGSACSTHTSSSYVPLPQGRALGRCPPKFCVPHPGSAVCRGFVRGSVLCGLKWQWQASWCHVHHQLQALPSATSKGDCTNLLEVHLVLHPKRNILRRDDHYVFSEGAHNGERVNMVPVGRRTRKVTQRRQWHSPH